MVKKWLAFNRNIGNPIMKLKGKKIIAKFYFNFLLKNDLPVAFCFLTQFFDFVYARC